MRLENGYAVIEDNDSIEACDKSVGEIVQDELANLYEEKMLGSIEKLNDILGELRKIPVGTTSNTIISIIQCINHLAYQNVLMAQRIVDLEMKLEEKENE